MKNRLQNILYGRKTLYLVLAIAIISVFTLSVAYAAMSAVLEIHGNSEVVASNWDIHLENVKVKSGSVSANTPKISGASSVSFDVELNTPGEFYEFTVDVVNGGAIDAMIDSVVKIPELTTEQSKYIKYEITYENGESISTKQNLKKGTSTPIKIRVEYRNDISVSDLPNSATELSLKFTLIYVQSDGSGSDIPNNGMSSESAVNMAYYSGIDKAVAAIGSGTVIESADASSDTGTIGVYIDNSSELFVVQLQSDITLTESLNVESDLMIDLNGHTISTTITPAIRTKSTNVIIDGFDAGSSVVVNAPATQKGTVLSVMSGMLTVNGGIYTANTAKAGTSTNQSQCLYAYNDTTLRVRDAQITSIDTNNGSVNGVTGKDGSNIILENSTVFVKSGVSLENRGVSSTGDVTLKQCDVRAIADYVANAAGTNYASNSRGVWCSGHLIMENCYVDGSHAGVTVQGTVYVNGGTYNGYGHGGIYLSGTAGPHYFYNADFNWAPMQEGSVSDVVAGTNGAGFYIGGTSNQTAYFDNCNFNMIDANGETYKGSVLPFYGIVLRTSGGEKNTSVYLSNCYVKAATTQMFRGNGTNGHIVYNGIGNDWSKAVAVHKGSAESFVNTNASYTAS